MNKYEIASKKLAEVLFEHPGTWHKIMPDTLRQLFPEPEMDRNYVIWSYEHRAWWAPYRCGYTEDLEQAGRYSLREAGDIVVNSVMVEELALHENIAKDWGPPKYDPYKGV